MFDSSSSLPVVENDPPPNTESFPMTENSIDAKTLDVGSPTTFKEIEAACAECQAFGDGEGFFGSRWHKRVDELLVPSFRLCSNIGDDQGLLAFVIAKSKLKTTQATRSNSALVAVQITARPHDTHQRKLCSGWALILNEARAENISVESFAEWVKTRGNQRVSSHAVNKCTEPSETASTNQLKLRLTGADGSATEILALPPLVHGELLDVLTTPCSQSERVQRLAKSLLVLADELKMAEEGAIARSPSVSQPDDASLTTTEVADG